jgi:hypothetical protein
VVAGAIISSAIFSTRDSTLGGCDGLVSARPDLGPVLASPDLVDCRRLFTVGFSSADALMSSNTSSSRF